MSLRCLSAGVRWFGILALLLMVFLPAAAQEGVRLQAFVQPSAGITEADAFNLIIRIEADKQLPSPRAKLPRLQNLKLLGGPQTSQQMRWINGKMTNSVTLTYSLYPDGPGAARIPPVEVTLGAETFRTDPIDLQIARSGSRGGGGTRESLPADGVDAFVEARLLEEGPVYVGQPVTLLVTLFSRPSPSGFSFRQEPTFANFWVENDTVDPDGEAYRATANGKTYRAFPMVRKVLIPSSAGSFTLDPYIGQFQVRTGRGDDFFDLFSRGRSRTVVRKTRPIELTVKRLPESGRPEDYGGAVGQFSLDVKMDRNEAAVDDAVSLRVTVRGEGFLKSVKAPLLDLPPDLKVFPPQPEESMRLRSGKLVASKSWEWILVPLASGEMRLPGVRFPFFDPESGSYRTLQAEPSVLTVSRGDRSGSGGAAATRGEIQVQRTDIAFIKARRGDLRTRAPRLHQQPWFLALIGLPWLLVPAIVAAGRWHSKRSADHGQVRARRARATARRRLQEVRGKLDGLESDAFHGEVGGALLSYLADRFGTSASGLTYDRVDELLREREVDDGTRKEVRTMLEASDFARYVPGAGDRGQWGQTLDRAAELVDRLERIL
ncbi:hypothetical protein ABI59_03600 [Acidobacteria bacterium Mor1]|nr:hypothetical protein ABI59_03600 [Acidobacteria bacterium Mor1]